MIISWFIPYLHFLKFTALYYEQLIGTLISSSFPIISQFTKNLPLYSLLFTELSQFAEGNFFYKFKPALETEISFPLIYDEFELFENSNISFE